MTASVNRTDSLDSSQFNPALVLEPTSSHESRQSSGNFIQGRRDTGHKKKVMVLCHSPAGHASTKVKIRTNTQVPLSGLSSFVDIMSS